LLASFYQKYKKISFLLVVIFTCLFLALLEWALMRTPSCVILLALIIVILSALLLRHLLLLQIFMRLNLLLNLVMKEQFSGASTDDAAAHR
jgi:hypothetical protein